jgi:N-acetylneuraminic acid mutarotase
VTVTATSQADPAKSASATVTLVPPTSGFQPIRVNAGGPSYTDPQGNVWAADTGFTGGSAYSTSNAIANTTTPTLYQTERYSPSPLMYMFNVPNGTYAVTLKFAELYFTSAGRRTFNVVLNGQTVETNFDVFAQAGGTFRAIDRSYAVAVTNGQVVIQLSPVIQNPKINAIEIVQGGTVVSVSPAGATLGASETQQFTGTVTGTTNTAVTWSISPLVGSISTAGLYTAPASITTQQTVTVTATSQDDPTKSASATVTLLPPGVVTVSVSPTTVSRGPSQTQQFTAAVSGTTNTAVTWSISPLVGSISTTGLYTAPSSITTQQTVTVTATSQADPAKSASATVTLVPPGLVNISILPTTATRGPSHTQQFTATVTGTTNTAVTWSITPTVGSISTTGIYTAPSSITTQQTVTVRVTSQADPTKSASAAVTLVPPANTSLFLWDTRASGPIGRMEAQGTVAAAKLYIFGGFTVDFKTVTTRADAYDATTNTWTRIADVPEALTHSAVVADGTTIYMIGGYVGGHPGPSSERVWKYNTVSNTWTAGPSLPATRGAGAAALVGRFLYFFGGATRTAGQTDDTDQPFAYKLSLDGGTSWTRIADMPNPRNHLGGIAVNGKVYAIGGQHDHEEGAGNQVETDVYDPATDTWTRVANLPTPRGHIAVVEIGGRILVMGNGPATSEVTLYDPVANVWQKLPSLPARRASAVAGVLNGAVIVTTGHSGNSVASTVTWGGVFTSKWEMGPAMPVSLGEVASGIIGNTLYVVGEDNTATVAYNLSSGTWNSTTLAARPFPGNHHAAEVVNGRLYLFGGLSNGSEGKVQIYNPVTNSWSSGANMPFAAGSGASALINGEVFVAGGIVAGQSVTQAAAYNPATNTWRPIAPMPRGLNHAASATDGSKFYVFGGRTGGNFVSNGEDTVQVYDPASNTWTSNVTGDPLAPLPQARGGMGKAVHVAGEFYVIGGETQTGAGATANRVYDRVDIYNPTTNTWRLGEPMPTARHGIFPVVIGGRIHVAGGGIVAGHSSSAVLQTYNAY